MSNRTPRDTAEHILAWKKYAELTDEDLGRSAEELMVEAIKADREQHAEHAPTVGFIIFTGPYEVWRHFDQGKERLEELLDAGKDQPTIVKVELTENGGTDVLGMTARKIIGTSSEGVI